MARSLQLTQVDVSQDALNLSFTGVGRGLKASVCALSLHEEASRTDPLFGLDYTGPPPESFTME